MGSNDYRLMNMVEDKAQLAGSNKMELLLFSLGGEEAFGINVFKVREVCELRPITATPNSPPAMRGIISLRGSIIPVIDLAMHLAIGDAVPKGEGKLIITEYSSHTQAFLVAAVDRIVRVDWDQVKQPPSHLITGGGRVTAITELPDGKLVSILDVEQILADVMGEEQPPAFEPVETDRSVFFVDDSTLARKKLTQVLEHLQVPFQQAQNGREAWERLQGLAGAAQAEQVRLADRLGAILVDAEMPEMDGYVLTRHIKSDARFSGIPVVMHSSLTSVANKKLGQQVGVDAYVAKFHFDELAKVLTAMLTSRKENQ
jgi:two-component system chemotaxis response regulator CheV